MRPIGRLQGGKKAHWSDAKAHEQAGFVGAGWGVGWFGIDEIAPTVLLGLILQGWLAAGATLESRESLGARRRR